MQNKPSQEDKQEKKDFDKKRLAYENVNIMRAITLLRSMLQLKERVKAVALVEIKS